MADAARSGLDISLQRGFQFSRLKLGTEPRSELMKLREKLAPKSITRLAKKLEQNSTGNCLYQSNCKRQSRMSKGFDEMGHQGGREVSRMSML